MSIRESRLRQIGRGIIIGLCALACVVALSLHTERVAAAGYTVNVPTDSGIGVGTTDDLRYAITQVNTSTDPANTITITATGAITLTSALPALAKPVAITGPGAAMLTVQAAATPKSAAYGVFAVNSGVTASISNLTIANGNAPGSGGGIANGGTLIVTNSTLSGNSAAGGGIYNSAGIVTVTNSTISSNSSHAGGGIFNTETATVTNSTFSGNSASNFGGGIDILNGTVMATNTIVAGNSAPSQPDINGAVVSHGHNLIGKTDGSTGWIASDKTGIVAAPLDPLLGALGDNGGVTPLPDGSHVRTLPLLSGSPAIDAGDDAVCARPLPPVAPPNGAGGVDERGITRPQGPHCDIGAFELQVSTPNPLPAPKPQGPNLGVPNPLPARRP